jgi:CDP-glycerol glycerophosphotransferase (TagB/SpsB family)
MRLDILIVPAFEWHKTILDPLAVRLQEWANAEQHLLNEIWSEPRIVNEPKLIVVCDAGIIERLRHIFPTSTFLHVGHGLISKNEPSFHYKQADYICVASKQIAEQLSIKGFAPKKRFLSTGLIQTDPLFNSKLNEAAKARGVRKTVIYAPTWNPTLSSAGMLGEELIPLIRGADDSIEIIIKPHPHLFVVNPQVIEAWRAVANSEENVRFYDEKSDLAECMIQADLMVSDASSAIFHFLALNRPIVLIDNPSRFSDPSSFDANGIEWTWRDIADTTSELSQLAPLVAANLTSPSRNLEARKLRRAQLFGDRTDGRSLERVNNQIRRILRSRFRFSRWSLFR